MGLCTSKSKGVTVYLHDANGDQAGPPKYGQHVALYGKALAEIVPDNKFLPHEEALPGSDDWLTVAIVTDSPDKLAAIQGEMAGKLDIGPPQTSGCSYRVGCELDLAGDRGSHAQSAVLVTGEILNGPTGVLLLVREIHIYPNPESVQKQPHRAKWDESRPYKEIDVE